MTQPDLSPAGRLAREGDEERFLAAMFAPAAGRERVFALIAFNCELAKIPATVSEPMLGEIRLQWWGEAVERMLAGGDAGAHEALGALSAAHGARAWDGARLLAMVEARRLALGDALAEEGALERFLAETGGAYHALAVSTLGGDEAAAAVAALAGWAEGAGRLIAAAPELAAEGAPRDKVELALAALAKTALMRLKEARARRTEIPRGARAPLLSVHMAEPVLHAAAARRFDPAAPLMINPARARLALLWRGLSGRF